MSKTTSNLKGMLSPYLKRQRLKRIARYVPGGARILDVGCDDGALLRFIPPFAFYLGIDIAADVILRNRSTWTLANASFAVADIGGFSEPALPFDIIAMAAVIEHLKDYRAVLGRLRQCAAEGARLLITTPAPLGDPILKAGSLLGIFDREGLKEHEHYFSRGDFTAIPGWEMECYQRFELGLNQLIVLRKTDFSSK